MNFTYLKNSRLLIPILRMFWIVWFSILILYEPVLDFQHCGNRRYEAYMQEQRGNLRIVEYILQRPVQCYFYCRSVKAKNAKADDSWAKHLLWNNRSIYPAAHKDKPFSSLSWMKRLKILNSHFLGLESSSLASALAKRNAFEQNATLV